MCFWENWIHGISLSLLSNDSDTLQFLLFTTLIPSATMIEWDFAYSDRGWCMVEGNDVSEGYLYQAPCQIGMKR